MGKNKKNNELRLERFFGNGIIILVVLIVEDLLLYMLINYLFNIVVNIGLGTGNWSHPEYYIGIKNILSVIKEKEITLDGQDQEKYHFHIRQLEKLIGGQK